MKYQIIFAVSIACVLVFAEAKPTKVCEPGTVVKKDCNECKCSSDGTDMACTRKMCQGSLDGADPVPESEQPEQKEQKEEKEQNDESDNCVPGEIFKKDCNDCTCPPSGLKSAGACTLLACLDDALQKD